MKYGLVTGLNVCDNGDTPEDKQVVQVTVDFLINRSILFEFMDALRPINQHTPREPIEALINSRTQPEITNQGWVK